MLSELGWSNPDQWLNYWNQNNGTKLAFSSWPENIKRDWIWGVGLPLLSDIKRCITSEEPYTVIGISGLPGCGKTSLYGCVLGRYKVDSGKIFLNQNFGMKKV